MLNKKTSCKRVTAQVMFLDITYMYIIYMHISRFSPGRIKGIVGGHGLGGTCVHIKAFGLLPYPHQRKCLLKPTCLENTGRTLYINYLLYRNHSFVHRKEFLPIYNSLPVSIIIKNHHFIVCMSMHVSSYFS